MKTRSILEMILIGIILQMPVHAQLWELYATSGDVAAGQTFVLLVWPANNTVAGYNIYRKETSGDPYPGDPLNEEPLSIVMTDCNDIKAVIPQTSIEWETMVYALADSIAFNPCLIASVPVESQKYERLQALAHVYWKISIVMGQAYADSSVTVGQTYWYEIRGVDETGTEISILDSDVSVTAGTVVPLPSPPNVFAEAGDSKVQITWDEMEHALGFEIERKTGMLPEIRINTSITVVQCTTNLAGDTIPKCNCFVDFQRWDSTGNPVSHIVNGITVDGPYNDTTYEYRVRALDILQRPGAWSSPWVSATSQDLTPPSMPHDVNLLPRIDGLEVRWQKVSLDVQGRKELGGIKGYWLYRFGTPDTLGDSVLVVDTLIHHPADSLTMSVAYKDTASLLRSDYGEKDYWYRVMCVDSADHESPLTPAVGGHLPDTTPPPAPRNLAAAGYADHIALDWQEPSPVPPDLAGYMVYRGVCGGDSVCRDSVCIDSFFDRKLERWVCTQWKCIDMVYALYPLHLVVNLDDTTTLQYDDYTVPLDAPICYRYAVKAYDRSQNLSDTSGTICARLQESTPPPPPIISGLKARDQAVKVEWVVAPVQDLFGFVIERAEDKNGPWIEISAALQFPEEVACESIPATNIWAADSTFSFYDTTAVSKKVYWYRVRAADYGGNVGDASAPIETYTFSYERPPQPINITVNPVSGLCALEITWHPAYDTLYLGFAVFRSTNQDCCYRQISPLIQGNTFIDDRIAAGKTYWYKIQYFGKDGNRSPVSDPHSGLVAP